MLTATADTRLFVHRIAEHWAEGSEAPHTPDDMRWRGSQAGMCARKVAYETLGVEKTDPPSTADYWRMGLGSVVHELLEPAVKSWLAKDDTVEIEEEVDVTMGEHGYGHVDLVLRTKTDPQQVIVLELKTINGYGYKMSVENGQGPRHSHVLQGALYANALDADLLVIGYLSMENIAPNRAEAKGIDDIGRFATEWHFPRDEYVPLAEQEAGRLAAITDQVHETKDPVAVGRRFSHSDPDVPFPAEISDPATGRWEHDASYGRAWQCRYCDFQTRCMSDME